MHCPCPDSLQFVFVAPSDGRISGREVPVVEECLDVHHRSTHHHRRSPLRQETLDVLAGGLLIPGDGRRLGDVEDVDLMMSDPATLVHGNLGRTDVHPPVLLHRVDVHDVPAQLDRQIEREVGLAARRGPDHRDGLRPGGHVFHQATV